MKCIVTGEETLQHYKSIPVSKNGRLKVQQIRDEIKDLLIQVQKDKGLLYEGIPRMVALALSKPVTFRTILYCFKHNKDPYEVYNVKEKDNGQTEVPQGSRSEDSESTEDLSEGAQP